jgi:hypothetical protein
MAVGPGSLLWLCERSAVLLLWWALPWTWSIEWKKPMKHRIMKYNTRGEERSSLLVKGIVSRAKNF